MTRQNIFPLIFMIGIALIPPLSIHIPRALSFLPLLFGLCMSVWWGYGKKEPLLHSKVYMYCILGICALCIFSSLWSIAPWEAYKRAIKASAILLFSIPLFDLALSVKKDLLKPFMWLFPIGVTAAALLCSFEIAFDLPIYQATHHLGPDYKVNTSVMNRGVVCTILSYFIGLLFIDNLGSKQKLKYLLATIMTLSVIEMLLLTQSQSGQLAFALGVLAFIFFPHKYKYSYKLLAIIIMGAMALTPWIVEVLFETLMEDAQTIPWLKDGYAGNRVEIWNFIMKYALNNPLYGYGMEATRFVPEFEHDYIYHKGPTILHPHNFSIQLWIDFGIIGVVAAGIFFTFLTHRISQLESADKKAITAMLIATLTVSAIGYGLWQSWWLGEFIFLSALCALLSSPQNKNKIANN